MREGGRRALFLVVFFACLCVGQYAFLTLFCFDWLEITFDDAESCGGHNARGDRLLLTRGGRGVGQEGRAAGEGWRWVDEKGRQVGRSAEGICRGMRRRIQPAGGQGRRVSTVALHWVNASNALDATQSTAVHTVHWTEYARMYARVGTEERERERERREKREETEQRGRDVAGE